MSGGILAEMTAEMILKEWVISDGENMGRTGEDTPNRAGPGKGDIFLKAEDSLPRAKKGCS